MEGYKNPIGVADWQNEFTLMSEEVKASLPSVEEIEDEINFWDSVIVEPGDGEDEA
jgi:hypothetical protein